MSSSTFRAFTSLTCDVKEKNKELPLGPLTSVCGAEASYKSSLVIGMRLALTGKFDAVGAFPSDLLTLAADKTIGMHCTLSGPDGLAEWRLKVDPDTGKAKRPEAPHFEGPIASLTEDERYCIIPTDSVRDLLKNARGEKKLREAFINRFGGSMREIASPFDESETEHGVWTAAVTACRSKLDADASADTLLASLSEYFRKESGLKRKEITPIEAAIKLKKAQVAQAEMDGGLSPELLPETEAQLARALAYEAATDNRETLGRLVVERGQCTTDIDAFVMSNAARSLDLHSKVDAAKAQVETTTAAVALAYEDSIKAHKSVATYETLTELYLDQEAKGLAKCRFCPHEFESIDAVVATRKLFESRAAERQELTKTTTVEYETACKTRDEASKALSEAEHTLEKFLDWDARETNLFKLRLEAIDAELEQTEEQLKKAPANYSGPPAAELQGKVDAFRVANDARAETEKEGKKLRRLEREYDLLKRLEGEAIELQKQTMVRVARRASDEVSLGMLDGRRARLDPHTCDWYVTRKDGLEFGPFGALCGTEKTSLLLGLVAAWTRGSPLRVAIFDDEDQVGLSTKGICDFYRQCEELYDRGDFSQIVVVSNRPELVPESRWHVIVREPLAQSPEDASV